jgi:signal transduction histidine kinase
MDRSEISWPVVREGSPKDGKYMGTDATAIRRFMQRIKDLSASNEKLENMVAEQSRELAGVSPTNSRVISIIAHDLRNPFISIIGILDMIREHFEHSKETDIKKYIEIAAESASSSLNLLDNLTAWAISREYDRELHPEEINLKTLLMDEVRIIRCSAVQKQVSLVWSIPPGLNIVADVQMIKTVLRNLINNAVKYSKSGGEVLISASAGTEYVEISVQDTGIGISFEDQRKLFKKDVLHSTPGTGNEKGTGLGLLLCREFVEKHNGKIRFISRPGEGSKFIVTLPNPD